MIAAENAAGGQLQDFLQPGNEENVDAEMFGVQGAADDSNLDLDWLYPSPVQNVIFGCF